MFKDFKEAEQKAFANTFGKKLFLVDVDKSVLWDTYINSFPEKEQQGYKCNACRSFISHYGKVVYLDDQYNIHTFWEDIDNDEFKNTTEAMAKVVKNGKINSIFLTDGQVFGCDHNIQRLEDGTVITWHHLYVDVPAQYIHRDRYGDTLGSKLGDSRTCKEVLKRSLEEFTDSSIETVLDLIESNALYRGQEFYSSLVEFKNVKNNAPSKNLDNYCWQHYDSKVAKFRNTAFGTLLIDLSEGKSLEAAVSSYEHIMAPTNYKRPVALITKKQIEAAQKTVEELGLTESLPRRHAKVEDISVNNVLFVNRDTKKRMKGNIFDTLSSDQTVNANKYKNKSTISIEEFINKVLPGSTNVEVLFENKHIPNLMTLTAPQNSDSGHLFKWDNNFAWVYNGSVSDSIREKVKAAGGNINATMRASLHWFNYDDLDIHCVEPDGNEIFYGNRTGYTGGILDVDMNACYGSSRDAVENIAWTHNILAGEYQIIVHNFCKRESIDVGFEVEIEVLGNIYNFSYNKAIGQDATIHVADIIVNRDGSFEVKECLKSTTSVRSSKEWNIDTAKFQKVSCIMLSPNYWDDNKVGNKHYFFMIDGCQNPDPVRGFFNEYLRSDLERDHKRVFEAIGSKAKTEFDENQLSGLGFSSTQHTELIVKVDNKIYKIKL